MVFQLAADLLVIIHLGFICFVVLGGFLVLIRRWIIFLHLPAAMWGALLEFQGWFCPLTPWEKQLRKMAGQSGYNGGFIEHYILPIIYPPGLTHGVQLVLGMIVVACNVLAYGWLMVRILDNSKNRK